MCHHAPTMNDHHWHILLGPTGLAAWRPIFRTAAGAARAAAWYTARTGLPTYVKDCRAACTP